MPSPSLPFLVSHNLCPYAQRVSIVASEKGVALERTMIDLADKPDWFTALSPTGKVPLVRVGANGAAQVLFESAAICEYLDETGPAPRLMPQDPIERARTRAWIEFASGMLVEIAGLYGAPDETAFNRKAETLRQRFGQLQQTISGPWFAGERFGLVDAAFGPLLRYLDAFERLIGLDLIAGHGAVTAWRRELARRPSVAAAIDRGYPARLEAFLRARQSWLGGLLA